MLRAFQVSINYHTLYTVHSSRTWNRSIWEWFPQKKKSLWGHISKLHRREGIAVAILQTLMTTETSLGFVGICHITVATTWLKTFAIYPRGKHTKSYRKWPIEIDGLPIKNGGSFHGYVKLPCRVCDLKLFNPLPMGWSRVRITRP